MIYECSLDNIPCEVQCIELSKSEKKLNYQHLKVLPINILFFSMTLFTSSSITSVSTSHITLMDSRRSGQSLDILNLSNHTLESPPFRGVDGLFKTKNVKKERKKGNDLKMDVLISKTLVF